MTLESKVNLKNAVDEIVRKEKQRRLLYKATHRNDSCPCGSGKKYKRCCLDGVRIDLFTFGIITECELVFKGEYSFDSLSNLGKKVYLSGVKDETNL